jgi:hypothetical protein
MKPSPGIIKYDFELRLSLGGKVTPHIPPPPDIGCVCFSFKKIDFFFVFLKMDFVKPFFKIL